VRLGPPEYFLLMVLAFITVSAVLGNSRLRGLVSLFIGLAIGLIGHRPDQRSAPLHEGVPELMDGNRGRADRRGPVRRREALYVMLYEAARETAEPAHQGPHAAQRAALMARMAARQRDRHSPSAPFRPAAARSRRFLSYAAEKKLSKHKEEFGTPGRDRGRCRSEAREQRRHHRRR
jgi:putative tricarboxylic transport membrane protein